MKQISIIVPFYRGLNQLDDCLESVREQELEKDSYEVLCMGDAPEEGIVSVINNKHIDFPMYNCYAYPTTRLATLVVSRK